MEISVKPIAFVSNEIERKKDVSWGEDISTIELKKQFYGGLNGLEGFSHAIIIYYLDKANFDVSEHLKRRPQNRDDMPLVGVFSQRGKDRSNQIGITTVQIVSVIEDKLVVKGLDAIDKTLY